MANPGAFINVNRNHHSDPCVKGVIALTGASLVSIGGIVGIVGIVGIGNYMGYDTAQTIKATIEGVVLIAGGSCVTLTACAGLIGCTACAYRIYECVIKKKDDESIELLPV